LQVEHTARASSRAFDPQSYRSAFPYVRNVPRESMRHARKEECPLHQKEESPRYDNNAPRMNTPLAQCSAEMMVSVAECSQRDGGLGMRTDLFAIPFKRIWIKDERGCNLAAMP